jgi:hypothetical protein
MGIIQQFCSTGSEDSSNKSGFVAIILGNTPHKKSVKSKIPPYCKDQYVSITSYTAPIGTKISYKHELQDLNFDLLIARTLKFLWIPWRIISDNGQN